MWRDLEERWAAEAEWEDAQRRGLVPEEMPSSMGEIMYDWAQRGADPDASHCPCRGRGWIGTPLDSWVKCRFHDGPHPEEDYE